MHHTCLVLDQWTDDIHGSGAAGKEFATGQAHCFIIGMATSVGQGVEALFAQGKNDTANAAPMDRA